MKQKTIQEIRELLQKNSRPLAQSVLDSIKMDTRKGVQKLWAQWNKQRQQEHQLQDQYIKMFKYERECYSDGFIKVAGVDEVGRGPLAGPVVACAVILDRNKPILGLNDSKVLSSTKRQLLYDRIVDEAIAVGVGTISSNEIDQINIYEASKHAMVLAVNNLPLQPDYLLIDAMTLPIHVEQKKLIKGDAVSNSIAAASIVAKVIRDKMMIELGEKYPQYSFATNAGYGTREHLNAIRIHGVTPVHRRSFAPVSEHIRQSETV
ncbi:ribonuclease HII [Pseudalkalibacillus decolorationis]|uniref:ribonuclease HII n=1 Tax=Pseudalkalibacillus decolorationis TaxID=163879 RepID=UPI0021488551|nr:ribonuclease HII [Pseudalkalibacillus decolorationis]